MVVVKRSQIKSLKVDDATTIGRYGFATNHYDIVEIIVDGIHGTVMNKKSTKSYYIISGIGTFNIDNNDYLVESGDIITVKPNQWLSIQGHNLKAIIITNPTFNPNDEEWKNK